MNTKVDLFFAKAQKWQAEMSLLREIILESELEEDYKWMHPCYTYQGNNIVLIHGFKEYCALLFFKGVLMKDPKGKFIQQTENVQGSRQIRFTNMGEIIELRSVIKDYIQEAVRIEQSGLKVEFKKTTDFNMPEEFRQRLEQNEILKQAFEKLTPGRQRGYLLHFSSAKQSSTRESRIEKYIPKILAGRGIDD